jgi:hypothetical protein
VSVAPWRLTGTRSSAKGGPPGTEIVLALFCLGENLWQHDSGERTVLEEWRWEERRRLARRAGRPSSALSVTTCSSGPWPGDSEVGRRAALVDYQRRKWPHSAPGLGVVGRARPAVGTGSLPAFGRVIGSWLSRPYRARW